MANESPWVLDVIGKLSHAWLANRHIMVYDNEVYSY